MTMKKQGKNKTAENPVNGQQKLRNQTASNRIANSGISQPHNAKKEGLGPNTNRGA